MIFGDCRASSMSYRFAAARGSSILLLQPPMTMRTFFSPETLTWSQMEENHQNVAFGTGFSPGEGVCIRRAFLQKGVMKGLCVYDQAFCWSQRALSPSSGVRPGGCVQQSGDFPPIIRFLRSWERCGAVLPESRRRHAASVAAPCLWPKARRHALGEARGTAHSARDAAPSSG